MKKSRLKIGILFMLSLGTVLFSCLRDEWFTEKNESSQTFSVREAKNYFQKNVGTIRQLEFEGDHISCSDPTHHHPATKSTTNREILTPEWSRATQVTYEKSVVMNIPVQESSNARAVLSHKQGNVKSAEIVKYQILSDGEDYGDGGDSLLCGHHSWRLFGRPE